MPLPPSHASPDQYFFAFEGDDAVFIGMDRDAYAQSIFLDRRIVTAAEIPSRLSVASLLPAPPRQRSGWIFHVAHCGSTLLARGLDRPGGGLVLREPLALRQLGVEAGTGAGPGWDARRDLAAGLLSRRYAADPPTVLKANVPVNLILPALLGDGDPAIMLHLPLGDWLLAVLRSAAHRNWVEFVTGELRPGLEALAGPLPDAIAERAAALWLAQLRAMAAAMATAPASRSLDAGLLFDAPAAVLAAAAALFEQPMAATEVAAIVAGPVFNTYAKNPGVAFDNRTRTAIAAEAARALAPDIARAREWITARLAHHPLADRLPRPLLADAPGRPLLG